MASDSITAALRDFLAAGGLPELGPGPRKGVLSQDHLEKPLDELLSDAGLSARTSDLVRALILLWHDRIDAAHSIAQGIEDSNGSFVHGIVHRREPDYSNARYWFRRVGSHEAFPKIAEGVERLLASVRGKLGKELISRGQWDAFAFIDVCERAADRASSDEQVKLLREIQGIESEVLLDHFLGERA